MMPTLAARRHKMLILYAFMMVLFLVLAYRQEKQTQSIRETAYQQCLMRTTNVQNAVRLYSGLIHIEEQNPYRKVSPETIQHRIDLYTQAMPLLPDCGVKP